MICQLRACKNWGNKLYQKALLDYKLKSKNYRRENYLNKIKVICPNPTLKWYMKRSCLLTLY